jgi:dolichyl-phosphate beta-glucosyltransferase
VDDGSTDGTSAVAAQLLSPTFPQMCIVRLPENSGKGAAVRAGAAAATAPVVAFMDADMSVDPREIPLLLEAIENAHVAIGSRSAVGSSVQNGSYQRVIMGRTFNMFVNAMTNIRLKDTQCGFKAFRTPIARILFHLMTVDRFAFDVEVLHIARQLGMQISEVPVQWQGVEGSTVRHLTDSLSMAYDVAKISARRSRPTIPALIVAPHADRQHNGDGAEVIAAAVSSFRHTDPILPLPHDRALVLLPLCQPTEVNGTASRLDRSASNVTVQRRLISSRELVEMLPEGWAHASADQRVNKSRGNERRRRGGGAHDAGYLAPSGVESLSSLEI